MSDAAEFAPRGYPVPIDEPAKEQLTTRSLLRELTVLACNNRRFRRGESDEVGFSLTEVEYFSLGYEIDTESECRVDDRDEQVRRLFLLSQLDSRMTMDFDFLALRERGTGPRPVTEFKYAATVTHENVALPAHLSRQLFEITPEQLADNVGLLALERRLEFKISTNNRELATDETLIYRDSNGTIVNKATTNDDQMRARPEYWLDTFIQDEEDEEDDDEEENVASGVAVLDEYGKIRQWVPAYIEQRMVHEAIALTTPEAALDLWASSSQMGPELWFDDYDEKLKLGFGTLRSIKQALREQAGL